VELTQYFATWHPAVVHFPIALLIAAAALEFFGYFRRDQKAMWSGNVLLVLGTVGLCFSFISGNFAEIWAARSFIPQDPIKVHESYATITSWAFIALVSFRSFISVDKKPHLYRLYLAFLVGAIYALYLTGNQGGHLVYQYGAGVKGIEPPVKATALDLSNLTLLNTHDELVYSEMMHHVFGWIVMGLALWLLYQMLELPGVDKMRAAGPILLSAGGLFLMIFSDFDAWPLSAEKPITDPEVLAHKIFATLLIVIALGMNLVRRRKDADVGRLQSHLVAVLALSGGGILFTHVHTGAPFSDVALGVYQQHFLIGVLALLCGGVKMMELAVPERRKLWDACWIALLFTVSGALLKYNEGHPWFLQHFQK
jgi:uncharacterized membrane protein